MRLTLLLLSGLLLSTTGCTHRARRDHVLTHRHHHSRHCHHRRPRSTAGAVVGLIGASVDLAIHVAELKAQRAREARRDRALARAIEARQAAAVVTPSAPQVEPRPATPPAPLTLTDRIGQRVALTLKDGTQITGILRGHTGVYAFVLDDADQLQKIPVTQIEDHASAGAMAAAP